MDHRSNKHIRRYFLLNNPGFNEYLSVIMTYHILPGFSFNMFSKLDPVLCGKRGSKFGKLGGRPSNTDQYGMAFAKTGLPKKKVHSRCF